jgi:sarcosine oxidase
LGAEVHLGEQVLSIERATDGAVVVRTALGEYEANRAVLSAGGWVSGFVPAEWKRVFQVYRQTLHWFAPARPADFKSDVFPTFIWRLPGVHGEHIYGFPLVDGTGGGVKVATAQLHTTTTPDTVDRHVTESECNLLYDTLLASRLPGLTRSSVKALACLYTVTPDEGFVIDHYPNWPEVALVSPCSGHGFKHSAAIGETVAELLTTGTTALDITPFRLQRFAGGQAGVPVPRAGGRTTMPE